MGGSAGGKLTALQVTRAARAREAGFKNDGGGLYLKDGSSWVFRYARNGRRHDLGLGPALDVTLAEAREKAREARRLLLDGKDPLAERRASRANIAKAMTFREVAEAHIAAQRPGWSAKHAEQWESTLATYVYPVLGHMLPDAISTADVLRTVQPIWTSRPVAAGRVRNRIELVLDAAKARGLRSGANVAAWRGHLSALLPKKSKVHKVEHFAAMPYLEIAEFMSELRRQDSVAALALEFIVLTATRSGEALGATWDEIDLEEKLWTIPGSRMKSGREHRVPLSAPAVKILEKMAAVRSNDFVFPGRLYRKPLSSTALTLVLRRMSRTDVTIHGFRSSFRDWAGNETNVAREVCEQALGHVTGDATEQAYRRSDALEKRRKLMDAWAHYCEQPRHERGNVVPIREAAT
jgi:integrase